MEVLKNHRRAVIGFECHLWRTLHLREPKPIVNKQQQQRRLAPATG